MKPADSLGVATIAAGAGPVSYGATRPTARQGPKEGHPALAVSRGLLSARRHPWPFTLARVCCLAALLLLVGCDREPCPPGSAINPVWREARAPSIPPGVVLCEGDANSVTFDFAPEPDTVADAIVVAHLEKDGWVRIVPVSHRRSHRTYILEKGRDTLTVEARTIDGRTQIIYRWRP